LKPRAYITGFISGFLICVFALGITPKQVLHDVLTNHKHTQVVNDNIPSINKDRFNCDDENLVAESPFSDHSIIIEFVPPSIFPVKKNQLLLSYHFLHQFFFELRGPPSLA
jgi:hypothetical protein